MSSSSPPPRILLAPDKFKGSLSAAEVCAAAEKGLGEIFSGAVFDHCPVADGGEGTCEAVADSQSWEWVECDAHDALGRPVRSRYLYDPEAKLALMEMSAASGYVLVGDQPRDPRSASTFGTGEMIRDAMDRGAKEIVVGIGGSATNDGGAGMAEALGWKFFSDEGAAISGLPLGLEEAVRMESPDQSEWPVIRAACDVDNPLLGDRGATQVYGPQKGVPPEEMAFFEDRLARLVQLSGGDQHRVPGAGAAGGLGFGLMAFAGATLEPGFNLVAELLDLGSRVRDADLVVVGEGSFDEQTIEHGKAPMRLIELAKEAGVPVLVLCGHAGNEAGRAGAELVLACDQIDPSLSVEDCMARGAELIHRSIEQQGESIRAICSP